MQKEQIMIPYFAHEGEMLRMERVNRRLWVLLIIVFMAFVLTNIGWIVYENQFEDITTTVEQQSDTGTNNYIGNDGDITYGEAAGDR